MSWQTIQGFTQGSIQLNHGEGYYWAWEDGAVPLGRKYFEFLCRDGADISLADVQRMAALLVKISELTTEFNSLKDQCK